MQITANIQIPCTPLASSSSSYCGDEQLKWATDADAVLAAQGINEANYDHVIYDIPAINCQWSGLSTLPGQWVMMNGNCGQGEK